MKKIPSNSDSKSVQMSINLKLFFLAIVFIPIGGNNDSLAQNFIKKKGDGKRLVNDYGCGEFNQNDEIECEQLVKIEAWYSFTSISEDGSTFYWPHNFDIVRFEHTASVPGVVISPLANDPGETRNPFTLIPCAVYYPEYGTYFVDFFAEFNSLEDLGEWTIQIDGWDVHPKACNYDLDIPPCRFDEECSSTYQVYEQTGVDIYGNPIYEWVVYNSKVEWRNPATYTITVRNAPPEANITHTPSVPQWNQVITFDANGNDPDGGDLVFRWKILEKPETAVATISGAETARPSLPFNNEKDIGVWKIQLDLDDDEGERKTFTHSFAIPNIKPEIELLANGTPVSDRIEIDAREEMELSAANKGAADPEYDIDGGELDFLWEVIEAPEGGTFSIGDTWNESSFFIPTSENDIGTWVFNCTVTDNEGDDDQIRIEVEVMNLPPVVKISPIPPIIDIGEPIIFDASESSDPDGSSELLEYNWDILQAPSSAPPGWQPDYGFSQDPAFAFHPDISFAGTWRFQLTITDNEGESVQSDEEIVVTVDGPVEAVIDEIDQPVSSAEPIRLYGGNSIDEDAKCNICNNCCHSTLYGEPPEVSSGIVRYHWTLVDFPPEWEGEYFPGPVDEVFGADAYSPELYLEPVALRSGDWTFRLEVWDEEEEGNCDVTEYTIWVIAPNSPPFVWINPPARYNTDGAGWLLEDIPLYSYSYDLDDVLATYQEPYPGFGIDNYYWEIVASPPGCVPPFLESGPDADSIHFLEGNTQIGPECLGHHQIELTVTDNDGQTNSKYTSVIIGNCGEPLCIDYPTSRNPEYVAFSENTDIFINYHLSSELVNDLPFGIITQLEVFHQEDLSTPFFTSFDPNVLTSDKGGFLTFHWNGYGDDLQRPKRGFYTIRITLIDFLGNNFYVVAEEYAIWMEVTQVEILASSDRYLHYPDLQDGIDQLDIFYEISISQAVDELHFRVYDLENNLIFHDVVDPEPAGLISWNGVDLSGAVVTPNWYSISLEAFREEGLAGSTDPYSFLIFHSDIDADINRSGTVENSEEDEMNEEIDGIVVISDQDNVYEDPIEPALRRKIAIREPEPFIGEGMVRVKRSSDKLKLYPQQKGGTELFDQEEVIELIPGIYWLQGGIEPSVSVRDEYLVSSIEDDEAPFCDKINVTILWVNISGKNFGQTHEPPVYDGYDNLISEIGHNNLGCNIDPSGVIVSGLIEIQGSILPNNLSFTTPITKGFVNGVLEDPDLNIAEAEFGFIFRRLADVRNYFDGSDEDIEVYQGHDDSPRDFQDVDPNQGNGKLLVIDVDGPGGANPDGDGFFQHRGNFEEYVVFNYHKFTPERCSRPLKWATTSDVAVGVFSDNSYKTIFISGVPNDGDTINEVKVGEHLSNLNISIKKPALDDAVNNDGKKEIRNGEPETIYITGKDLIGRVYLKKEGWRPYEAEIVVVKPDSESSDFSDLTEIYAVFNETEPWNPTGWKLVIENAAGESNAIEGFEFVDPN